MIAAAINTAPNASATDIRKCRRFDCQNRFEPKVQGGQAKLFCSGYCKRRWHRIRCEALRWVWATLRCTTCGVGFSTRNSAQEYCTKACWAIDYSAKPEVKARRARETSRYYQRNQSDIAVKARRKRQEINRCDCGVLKPRAQAQCAQCAALPTPVEVLRW